MNFLKNITSKPIIQFLKLLFKEIYLYLALILTFLSILNTLFPKFDHPFFEFLPLQYILPFLFFLVSFNVWKKEHQKRPSPKVMLHYKIKGNLLNFEIHNMGDDYARNVKMSISPQSFMDKYGEMIPKQISQIAPNEKTQYFIGIFDENYIKFIANISYTDSEEKERYRDSCQFDFSSLIGTSTLKQNDELILKEIGNISKNIKDQNKILKDKNQLFKNGINVRNIDLQTYEEKDLKQIIRNLVEVGSESDFYLNPFIFDLRQIIKVLKYKMLSKKILTEQDKKLIEQLTDFEDGVGGIINNEKIQEWREKTKDLL